MKGNTLRWLIGSVVVPLTLGILTVFGVQLSDELFPEIAPALDAGDIRHMEQKIVAIEANIELLARLHILPDATARPPKRPEPQTQEGPQKSLQIEEALEVMRFQPLIAVANESEYLGRRLNVGRREWNWTIHLSGTEEALNAVHCVTYRLHPTFSKTSYNLCKEDGHGNTFGFTAKGWGTFNVHLTVTFDDGSSFVTNHYLVFESGEMPIIKSQLENS